jgi:deoxycytidine triphosphate deaminase
MAILTKKEIINYIKSKKLNFVPNLDQFQLQPHAIDLRLGFDFFIPKKWEINKKGRCALNINYIEDECYPFDKISLKPGQWFEILPNETVIAKVFEYIEINHGKLMAILYPRSSLNRRGLAVDLTGVVDTYYKGNLIVPIKNNTNQVIKLFPGERFCSLVVEELISQLNMSSANMHGLNHAKYCNNGIHSFQKDKKVENDLIKKGDILKIKKKYKLDK